MFAAQDIVGLFPSLAFRAGPLPGGPEALQSLAAAAEAQPQTAQPPGQRRRSPPTLQTDPGLQPLVQHLARLAVEALAAADFKRQDCVVTALWSESLPPGFSEPPQVAPNAHFSFVLPLAAPGGLGLRVADPRPAAQVIVPMVSEPNELNAREVTIPLVAGQILLLPGWLPQGLTAGPAEAALLLRGQTLFRNMAEAISPPMWTGMTANRT